jgi:hypothetical protein
MPNLKIVVSYIFLLEFLSNIDLDYLHDLRYLGEIAEMLETDDHFKTQMEQYTKRFRTAVNILEFISVVC